MKIAVIGGGGVHTPQLVETLTGEASRIHLEHLGLVERYLTEYAAYTGVWNG